MRFNTTISHASPFLTYVPQALWSEGDQSDPSIAKYTNGSYHMTNSSVGRASMILSWSGTGVWISGAYRSRLGPYEVMLDNTPFSFDGFQDGDEESFQYTLFGSSGLDTGIHEVSIVNVSPDPQRSILDIDHIIIETDMGGGEGSQVVYDTMNTSSFTFNMDDNSTSSWSYEDQSAWTSNPDGSATLRCEGEAMSVYGPVGGQSSPIIATLDGTTKMLSANTVRSSNDTELIYFASGLDPNTEHTLVLYNNPSYQYVGANQSDLVYRTILSVSSATCASGVSLHMNSTHRNIIIILSSIISLSAVFVLYMWWFYHKHQRAKKETQDMLSAQPYPSWWLSRYGNQSSARPTGNNSLIQRKSTVPPSMILDNRIRQGEGSSNHRNRRSYVELRSPDGISPSNPNEDAAMPTSHPTVSPESPENPHSPGARMNNDIDPLIGQAATTVRSARCNRSSYSSTPTLRDGMPFPSRKPEDSGQRAASSRQPTRKKPRKGGRRLPQPPMGSSSLPSWPPSWTTSVSRSTAENTNSDGNPLLGTVRIPERVAVVRWPVEAPPRYNDLV